MIRISQIKEFCATGTGGTPSRDLAQRYYEGGTIPWVKSGELRESIINEPEEHVTQAAVEETNLKLIPAGALLLAMYGATVGRLGILGVPATTNQAICHIIPDPAHADTRYLFHLLQESVPVLLARRVGGAQPNISQGIVRSLEVPLPPLADQRRIAEILDKTNALRANRRAALTQLDLLTQSVFLDLFGDPAVNPKKWPMVSLKECTATIQIGPFGSLLHQQDYVTDGVPLVNPKHIQNGAIVISRTESVTLQKYRELTTYHLLAGDVVMGRRGEMGRCAMVGQGNSRLICGTGSLFVRPDKIQTTSLFLCTILSSRAVKLELEQRALGQTLPNLNSRIVEQLTIPLPPFSLQQELARRVAAVERLKATQRASLAEMDVLFASLQHRAFQGQL